MSWIGKGISVAILFVSVIVLRASPVRAEVVPDVFERKIFYLDWGFVGRPVTLETYGGRVRLSWEAGDLTAPTMLMVEVEASSTDPIVHITWADPYHLSSRGIRVDFPQDCQSSAWISCSLLEQQGSTWVEKKDGRVYGHVRVRLNKEIFPYMREGMASWYAYKNCRCAASPDFPKSTRLRVRLQTNPSVFTVVKVNDWGPERAKHPERAIDLDKVAFKELGTLSAGVVPVIVEPLDVHDPDYVLADVPVPVTVPTPTVVSAPKVNESPAWNY